jgi:flagellar biosynthetic protein FliR
VTDLAPFVALLEPQLAAMILVYARVGTVALFLPPLGETSLPGRVRIALGLVLTLLLLPLLPLPVADGLQSLRWKVLLSELLAGLAIGLLLRLAVVALQICGTIVAQTTSLGQLMGAAGMEPLPVIGHILVLAGLALAMMTGFHLRVLGALAETYALVPIGSVLSPGALSELAVRRIAGLFGLAFSLSAPFVIVSILYNLALGVVNRAMPQLMVVLVGAPAIIGATLVLFAVATPLMLQTWLAAFHAVLAAPLGGP